MSNAEQNFEKYEFENDKHMFSGHSGKQRTKAEAEKNTNHHDANGHTRKIVTKLQNSEKNKKESK
jgi:nuclear protein 1